jgi:aspartyl protease family protein
MRNLSPVLAFFLFSAYTANPAEINVIALTAGNAVLMIDGGKPRTLTVGDITPEKVKLISAISEAALIRCKDETHDLCWKATCIPLRVGRAR